MQLNPYETATLGKIDSGRLKAADHLIELKQ